MWSKYKLFYRHAESNSGLYFAISQILKEVLVILSQNSEQSSSVSKSFQSQVSQKTHPYCKQSEIQSVLDSFGKNNRKKNKQLFCNQIDIKNCQLSLKQFIGNPEHEQQILHNYFGPPMSA